MNVKREREIILLCFVCNLVWYYVLCIYMMDIVDSGKHLKQVHPLQG